MPDLTITLRCNNNCSFCPREILSDVFIARRGLWEYLKNNKRKSEVVLTGGEVTLLKDIARIIRFCRKSGYAHIGIVTNGRRLSDWKFSRDIVKSGVSDIAVSIYSTSLPVHDSLTNVPGSCEETLRGLRNIVKIMNQSQNESLSLRVNLLINSINLSTIRSSLLELYDIGVRKFALMDVIAIESADWLVPYSEIQKLYLLLSRDARFAGADFTFRGYPICIFLGHGKCAKKTAESVRLPAENTSLFGLEIQNFDTHIAPSRGGESRYLGAVGSLFRRLDKCRRCGFSDVCQGVQRKYIERFCGAE